MKSQDKPETYKIIPAQMVFPCIPILAKDVPLAASAKAARRDSPDDLLLQGITTLSGSVAVAEAKTDALLAECRRCVKRRDFATFLDYLDANPFLVWDKWVRETLQQLAKQKRLHRRRGRPKGGFEIHPLLVVGLVTQWIESGEAANVEQALHALAELEVMSYESVKDSYYRALRQTRFRPIFLKSPELARVATAEEAAGWHSGAEVLPPGGTITRTVEDAQLGTVEITFEAKK